MKMPTSTSSTQSSKSSCSRPSTPSSTVALAPVHPHRATHQIRLSALRHNYSIISSAASRQQCSVIVVVKADGYGHGAIETALQLADHCGADSFAVATINEGVALRKALNQDNAGISTSTHFGRNSPNGCANTSSKKSSRIGSISDLFLPPPSVEIGTKHANKLFSDTSSIGSASVPVVPLPTVKHKLQQQIKTRSKNIRILVLGPPTNLPDDFALYQQFHLELMCSGPQIARALMEWVADCDTRRIQEVEEAANYQKSILMEQVLNKQDGMNLVKHNQASTLSNVEGAELGKEVRAILLHKESLERSNPSKNIELNGIGIDNTSITMSTSKQSIISNTNARENVGGAHLPSGSQNAVHFKGIEDAAKSSRAREKAVAKVLAQATGEEEADDGNDDQGVEDQDDGSQTMWNENDAMDAAVVSTVSSATVKDAVKKVASLATKKGVAPAFARRKIRWHALVDSGMGRLGFKSVEDEDECGEDITLVKLPAPLLAHANKYPKWKVGPHRDTVSIIKAMTDAEIHGGAPLEFYGMCTHMAEASPNSNYTNEQMTRFKSLLKRVRQAGIAVPTISTDNSSALLTTSLTHFNPAELLIQDHITRSLGYVRTGGGIYGQRPAFPTLRDVSSLTASVRHVAIVQEGQSVGYDRAYIAPRDVRIATLTIGFADGYPRELGNGRGSVSIRGALFPISGNVCMDMLMVNLGPAEDVEGIGSKVCVGDRAFLWGPENETESEGQIRLQDLAKKLNTTQSALTCGLNKARVQRQYVE